MTVRRPGRTPGFPYRGQFTYLLTCCTESRRPHLAEPSTADQVLSQIRRPAASHQFALVAYCFMPDHLHLVVEGLSSDSDLQRFAASFKQHSGYRHQRRRGVLL